MTVQLSCFILVTLGSIVLLANMPCKWRPLRKRVILVLLGIWTLSAIYSMAGVFKNRPFFVAVESRDTELVKELLSKKPLLVQSRTFLKNETGLHLAAKAGHHKMVELLL